MPSTPAIAPSRRLARDARAMSALAAASVLIAALIALAEVGAMALRSARAGVLDGGFAFIVGLRWLGLPDAPVPPTFTPIQHFALWQSTLAAGLLALRLLPGLVILWSLMRLFGTYGRGEVFSRRNTRCVRTVGWSLLAYAAVPLLTHATLYMAAMSQVAWKLESRQLDALVAGFVVLAIAHVVSFGVAIDEDSRGFV